MVRISLQKIPGQDLAEYCIIELQGSIEPRDLDENFEVNSQLDASYFTDKFLGDLHFQKSDGKPLLIVGHHSILGSEVKLKKPFAVIQKIKNSERSRTQSEEEELTRSSYLVKALIKKKFVFNKRPQPIIIEKISQED